MSPSSAHVNGGVGELDSPVDDGWFEDIKWVRATEGGPKRPKRGMERLSLRGSYRHLPLILMIVAYCLWFCTYELRVYNGYGYPPFDLAIFDQGLWLLSHFHAPFVTVMGRDLFGDHTSFILLGLVPFYRLVPEPQGLLFLQTFVLAGTAVPIYLLGRRLIKSTFLATVLAGAYLLNPALQQGNMEQFHPESLQVLIIALAIYAAVEKRAVMLAVMVFLSLMVKEDAAALVIVLGAWVWWRRDRRWGLSIMGVAAAWALLANLVIIPAVLGARNLYAGRIPFGGVGGLFATIFRRPGQFVSYVTGDHRPFYVWQMGFATGWGFLASPEIAGIGVLLLVENVISDDPYMHQILYHYSLPLTAVFALGTVYAISRQKTALRRHALTLVVFGCALWSCVLWGLAPFSFNTEGYGWTPNSATGRAVAYVEKAIAPTASVSAWWPYVAHLDHRVDVYVWPNPFAEANWGLGLHTGNRLVQANTLEYLMIPIPITGPSDYPVWATISAQYKLIRSEDGVGLFKRIGS